jgi:PPOX class probable F420-dependent enzyme
VDHTEALEFIRANHRSVLATTRSDGNPQLSPVAATVDADGKVVVSTRQSAMKTKNLEKRPRAALMCLSDNFYGPWVQVEGPVEIVRLPEAMEGLVAYYRSTGGEHPDWDEYRAAMVAEGRVLVRITVDRVGPTQSG